MNAATRWAQQLRAWALPDEILAAAPESPWGFPVELFVDLARTAVEAPLTPTHRRVIEALPAASGVLLDVGAGGGAASLPAADRARRIVAVDESEQMLAAMRELGGDRVDIETVVGRWPDVAHQVGDVDVTVCANVAYNVADLAPFIDALTAVARSRVVLELGAAHPQSALSPLWQRFWKLTRPTGPTADDAAAVIHEVTGHEPSEERWTTTRSFINDPGPDRVARVRRRLCLPDSYDAEVAAALAELPLVQPTMVTLWWSGSAAA